MSCALHFPVGGKKIDFPEITLDNSGLMTMNRLNITGLPLSWIPRKMVEIGRKEADRNGDSGSSMAANVISV